MRTQWQVADAPREHWGDFDPVLWDAIHGTASDVFDIVCDPVIRGVVEAFEVHRELLGYPDAVPDDCEPCGFAFALAGITLQRAEGTRERYDLMLQSVGAKLYQRYANRSSVNALAFWVFLKDRADTFYRDPRSSRRGYDVAYLTHRFLSLYGLGGRGNEDLVISVNQLIAPHLYRGLEVARGMKPGHGGKTN